MYGGKFVFVGLEPEDAILVETEIPVVAVCVLTRFLTAASAIAPLPLFAPPDGYWVWACPGSETVDVAVCVWEGSVES